MPFKLGSKTSKPKSIAQETEDEIDQAAIPKKKKAKPVKDDEDPEGSDPTDTDQDTDVAVKKPKAHQIMTAIAKVSTKPPKRK